MLLLLFLAFLSGLVTIFAPCIWPILPIVLSAGVNGNKHKPLGLVTGLSVSFIFFTLALSSLVKIFSFDPEVLRYVAVIVIGFLGLMLVIPQLGEKLEAIVSRLGSLGSRFTQNRGGGFGAGFITGAALGLIWTPCAGPILAAVATLAATQTVGLSGLLLISAYVAGVSVPLYLLTFLGGRVLSQTRTLSRYTGTIQRVFGVVMIVSAILIFTGYDKKLQTKILDNFPQYGSFLYVFENQAEKTGQLEKVRQGQAEDTGESSRETSEKAPSAMLKNLGKAPEITGIEGWINTDGTSLRELKGKVVLVDFWTYSCINCIRTLPHVTSWYEQYKDQGFVVIGVHTPEFAFEHKKENVAEAVKKYAITYPVAQDNNYATWQAYNNRYWPAHYLIDAEGNVRYTHFGEGKYEETEALIVELLKEAGHNPAMGEKNIQDETPRQGSVQTPETYLGSARGNQLSSPEIITQSKQVFTAPKNLEVDQYAFEGEWQVEKERAVASPQGALTLYFQGEKVFLVMSPEDESISSTVNVYLDGKRISPELSGKDVKNGQVSVEQERLYEIIDLRGMRQKGLLKLEFENAVGVYAFTFA